MAVLPILIGRDHPMLRKKALAVPAMTKEIRNFIRDMQDTVQKAEGAGLAAPQVDKSLRLCLALVGGKMIPLINPRIVKKGVETEREEEGCLSIPGLTVLVTRAKQISVHYLDGEGVKQERIFKDFDARVVQHEVDHLDGILITDYIREDQILRHEAKNLI